MNKAVMEEIGLTKGECKVYLSLIELGSTSIGRIIEKSGISGSKAYEVLDRLMKKGLASFIMKGQVKYFEASSPERILDYLEEKKSKIEETKSKAVKMIQELKLKQALSSTQSDATVFIGEKGAKTAYVEAKKDIKKGETIYGMFIPPVKKSFQSFIVNWQKDFAKRYGGVDKLIFNEPSPQIEIVKKIPNFQVRMVPERIKSPTEISIIGNNVIISTTGGNELFTIMIRNKQVAESFIKYFDAIWKISKPA